MKTILFFIFLFSYTPVALSFSGKGSGTKNDPYQVTNINQLQEMKDYTHGKDEVFIILMNDIDATETRNWNIGDHDGNPNTPYEPMGFEPLSFTSWNGVFNGKGFVIKNLYINRPRATVGLFGNSTLSTFIGNVGLEDCDITGGTSAGSICGFAEEVSFYNCFSTGKVKAIGTAGAFVAYLLGSVENCYTHCTVTAAKASSFCGDQNIANYYYCYATGKANGAEILPVYGTTYRTAVGCVWDIETTGSKIGGAGSFGLTTTEMMKKSTIDTIFTEFDRFWCIEEGKDYPRLRIFGDCPSNVADNKERKNMDIYLFPNPATDYIEISYPPSIKRGPGGVSEGEESEIKIYNTLGERVVDLTPSPSPSGEGGNMKVDISGLPPGLYFINIKTEILFKSKPIIILR